MGDNKQWFKVWTSILSDPGFSLMSLENWGRWLKISAMIAMHGIDGSITIPLEYYEKQLEITVTSLLHLPNIKVKNDNGTVTVTLKNWSKYQTRSESYDRVMRYREKQKDTLPVTVTETLQEKGVTVDKIRREEKRKEEEKKKIFMLPTLEEVTSYCLERGSGVNPQKWMDHYTSNGWMVGKNKMKDWRASVRTWETESTPKQKENDLERERVREAIRRKQAGISNGTSQEINRVNCSNAGPKKEI